MKSAGRLFQRGKVWWIDYYHRGKRYRESSESTTKKDARALLKKRLGECGTGKHVGKDEAKVTLADLKKITVDDYRRQRLRSLDRLEVSWLALENHFGLDFRAIDLGVDTVNAFTAERQSQGKADNTIRNEIGALRRGLRLAHQAGRISSVPYTPMPSEGPAREGFLTREELDLVLKELPDYLRPVTLFAYFTGWRKKEVLNLRWNRIDFESGEIRLTAAESKNKTGRTFPFRILSELAEVLAAQLEHTRKLEKERGKIISFVFHRNGNQIKCMKNAWNAACRRVGLAGTIFHDLRRCAVKNLEAAGVSRSVAMSLTGHKTESIYKRYAIADKAAQEEGVKKLDQHFQTKEERKVIPFKQAAEG
jgi:integrase